LLNAPFKYKVGLINCLLSRAFKISSSWKLFSTELDKLREMFCKNGYPSNVFDSCIRKYIIKVFKKDCPPKKEVTNVIVIDYFGLISDSFCKKIKKICKSCDIDCNIVFKTRKLSSFFSLKSPVPTELKSMSVYAFSCPDAQGKPIYIGKTTRHMISRMKEHRNKLDSSIHDHILTCNKHLNFFQDFKILSFKHSDFELKITESLLIKKLRPTLNIKSTDSWNYTLKLF